MLVRFKPGLPETICERLILEIAHFDPIEFPIYGEGIYPQVHVSLPRDESKLKLPPVYDNWNAVVDKAKGRLYNPDLSLCAPPPDQLPPLKLIRSWSATQQVDFKKRRMKYWCAPNPSDSVRPCQRDCSFSSRSRCPEPWIAELFPCL